VEENLHTLARECANSPTDSVATHARSRNTHLSEEVGRLGRESRGALYTKGAGKTTRICLMEGECGKERMLEAS
jgi:hypothetical protein